MSISFRPAVREQVGVLVALAGASGSGKTFTALQLAKGMTDGDMGKVAFLDTEARRGLHYADRFSPSFLHGEMRPPFRPANFIEAIKAAEASGAEVIIIDSFSHEYDGEDGILDWAAELEEKGTKAPGNWKVPKLAHKRLMNLLLQVRASIIFCLRADEKIEIVKEGGRTQVRPLGWMPICEKRFMFEMTASFTLIPDAPGYPQYGLPHKLQDQHRGFFPEGARIGEQAGAALRAWAAGGAEQPAGDAFEDAAAAARDGKDAFTAWWNGRGRSRRAEVKPRLDELQKIASDADAAMADPFAGDQPPLPAAKPDELTDLIDAGKPEPLDETLAAQVEAVAGQFASKRLADHVHAYFDRPDVQALMEQHPEAAKRIAAARDKRLRELAAGNGGA